MSKPREFWIELDYVEDDGRTFDLVFRDGPKNWCSPIHVIEKQAADKLAEALEQIILGTIHFDMLKQTLKEYRGEK